MFRYNLLLFYRSVKRSKTTFFINLAGLSTGIACALMISLWVMDEWSFDRYHENGERLFQVMERAKTEDGVETVAQTKEFLAEVLAAELPGIEYSVTVTPPFFFPAFALTKSEKLAKARASMSTGIS